MSEIVLSICIPTYNREAYLQRCLDSICKQMTVFWDTIELIVSDNCSEDATEALVKEYQEKYPHIRYNRNESNLGVDRNLEWCFKNAAGKYFWIIGDDDLVLDDKLKLIFTLLEKEEPAMLYLNGYSFVDDYKKEQSSRKTIFPKKAVKQFSQNGFVKNINYLLTFGTGNIVDKTLLDNTIDFDKFSDSNLSQTAWYFSIMLNGKKFIKINEFCIAAKRNNSGGYSLFKVFSINFNELMDYFITHKNMPYKYKRVINFNLLLSFFPYYLLAFRKNNLGAFVKENPKEILFSVYKNNIWFYLFVYPIIKLPVFAASIYHKFALNLLTRIRNEFV